jgi:hypothetical protein
MLQHDRKIAASIYLSQLPDVHLACKPDAGSQVEHNFERPDSVLLVISYANVNM